MGRPIERDWEALYQIWQNTKGKNGKPLSVKRFCKAHGLPISSTYTAFGRIEEERGGPDSRNSNNSKNSENSENTAKTRNVPKKIPKTESRSKNSRKVPETEAQPPTMATDPDGNPDFSIFLETRRVLVEQLTRCRDALSNIAGWAGGFQTDGAEPKDVRSVSQTLKDTVSTLKDLSPTLSEAEADAYRTWILNQCLRGEFSAEQAALHFELIGVKIPEAVEIVLRRPRDLPEPVPAEDDIPDDAELDAVYEESVAKIKAQKKKWLPDRRDDISDLKEEMATEAGEGYVRADDDDKGGIGGQRKD